MAHVRAQIRDAIRTRIEAVLGFGTLDPTPVYDHDQTALPTASVLTPSDTNDRDRASHRIGREVTVVIECYAADVDDLPGVLDGYAVTIEQAIDADKKLGGVCTQAVLDSTDHELSDGAEQPRGILRMTYLVSYSTDEGAPENPV